MLEIPDDCDIISVQEGEDQSDAIFNISEGEDGELEIQKGVHTLNLSTVFMLGEENSWYRPRIQLPENQMTCAHKWVQNGVVERPFRTRCSCCTRETMLRARMHCPECGVTVCNLCGPFYFKREVTILPNKAPAQFSLSGLVKEQRAYIIWCEAEIDRLKREVEFLSSRLLEEDLSRDLSDLQVSSKGKELAASDEEANDPSEGSTVLQDQAYRDLEQLTCTSVKYVVRYMNDYMRLAAKTGRMYINPELSEKFWLKMPNDLGTRIKAAFDAKYPGLTVGVIPRILFAYKFLENECNDAAFKRALKDLSFCSEIPIPGYYKKDGKKYGLRFHV